MRKNISKNKAMTLMIAIALMAIMLLISVYIISFIIPFAKNTKNIENTTKAYYQAQGGVEQSLFFVKNNFGVDSIKNFNTEFIDYYYNLIALGNLLPISGKGNSEFDNNFNKIKIGVPIQLEVGKGLLSSNDWDNIKFSFRIPSIGGGIDSNSRLNGGTLKIINWQLTAKSDSLNSDNSQILANDLSNGGIINEEIFGGGFYNDIGNNYYNGLNLNDNSVDFKTFYYGNCEGIGSGCILKMSIVNKIEVLKGSNLIPIPYLEWKIDLIGTSEKIPLRYSQIYTEGKSYGFKKNIKIRYPQQTVNEAFDFTVFQ